LTWRGKQSGCQQQEQHAATPLVPSAGRSAGAPNATLWRCYVCEIRSAAYAMTDCVTTPAESARSGVGPRQSTVDRTPGLKHRPSDVQLSDSQKKYRRGGRTGPCRTYPTSDSVANRIRGDRQYRSLRYRSLGERYGPRSPTVRSGLSVHLPRPAQNGQK